MSGAVARVHERGRSVVALSVLMVGMLALLPCAFALDPKLDVSQYAHTAWEVPEGFAKNSIGLIAQTPDGYLWLGTDMRERAEHLGGELEVWSEPRAGTEIELRVLGSLRTKSRLHKTSFGL